MILGRKKTADENWFLSAQLAPCLLAQLLMWSLPPESFA